MKSTNRSLWSIVINIIWPILSIATIVTLIVLTLNFFHNPAAEVAKPLESALSAAGIQKVCSKGDAGNGPDSRSPHYGAYYQFNTNKEEALRIVNEIAEKQGWKLTRTDSNYENIENYDDTEGRPSNISGLQPGKILIGFTLYTDTSKNPLGCSVDKNLVGDKDRTAVVLGVGVPDRK